MSAFFPSPAIPGSPSQVCGFPTLAYCIHPFALQSQDHDLGCSFIFPLAFCSGLVTGFPFPLHFHGAILCAPVPRGVIFPMMRSAMKAVGPARHLLLLAELLMTMASLQGRHWDPPSHSTHILEPWSWTQGVAGDSLPVVLQPCAGRIFQEADQQRHLLFCVAMAVLPASCPSVPGAA